MSTVDLLVIGGYFLAALLIVVLCHSGGGSAEEFFTGRGTLSGAWGTIMIGLSIAATLFSGISLVVYVSAAYTDGIKILLGLVALLISWMVLHWWFLPRYLADQWDHPYEIIERRFGGRIRLFLSAQFLLLRLAWMGILIYAPTAIILGSAGLDDRWFWPVVLVIGVLSTAYSVVGGIRGVIVMDAIQFIITTGCMFVILLFIAVKLGYSPGTAFQELHAQGRLALFDEAASSARPLTFWSVLLGMLVTSFGSYFADQMSLQRYLVSGNKQGAGRSFMVNIVGAFSIVGILVLVGLMLWLWYRHNPDPSLPAQVDQVLSHFIATQLPAGVSGLLVAAILAATIDSMTSGINAVSSALANDWLVLLGRKRSPEELLRFGRWTNVVIGLLSTLSAGLAATMGRALDSSQILMGAFLGSMLACMVLAVSPIQVRPADVGAGMALGLVSGWLIAGSSVSVMWVAPAAFCVALLIPLGGWVLKHRH